MSRINFATGDMVDEIDLDLIPGTYEREIPLDAEFLEVGTKEGRLKIFYVSKYKGHKKMRTFLVHETGKGLPRKDFNYYFYLGSVSRKGLHVFEVV